MPNAFELHWKISARSPEQARAYYDCVFLETQSDHAKRSHTRLQIINENTLQYIITAKDVVALKANIHSIVQNLALVESIFNMSELKKA